jgi:uncharacterized protein (TIGR03790 family)
MVARKSRHPPSRPAGFYRCRGVRIRCSIGCVKSNFFLRRGLFAGIVCVGLLGGRAAALEPDEIALVVNSAEPAGKELAAFYAAQRHIPDNRILELDNVPKTDEMTTREYEQYVVPQVRDFLKSGGLQTKIKCLVTFYGVPLRISGRVNSPEEAMELNQLRHTLIQLPPRLRPGVEAVEALDEKLDPTFVPVGSGSDLLDLQKRWAVAQQKFGVQIKTVPDRAQQGRLLSDFFTAASSLEGKYADIQKMRVDLLTEATTHPANLQPVEAMVAEYTQTINTASKLEPLNDDPTARKQLRGLVEANFGLLRYLKLLRDQVDYLDPEQSASAFDSELTMVESLAYRHKLWITNPLYYQMPKQPGIASLMVMRLDAPTPDLVKSIITTSIKVEQEGLTGKVVLDSMGIKRGHDTPEHPGYSEYDQSLRNVAQLVRSDTKLDVMLDEKPEVLPAGSATDVALYCGWHSPRNYIPACKFNPGAVGYHIASYELVSLRGPNESGWVHGLLEDGVCATLGPVAEPYLGAFPKPDEFFPLLLTGKLTMAETYWKTEPSVSWMMSFIGDPLYTPYKKNPQLTEAELPFRLRAALH